MAIRRATIRLKRVYEPPFENDGTRILVERLWPRGVSKEKAAIDLWLKEIAQVRNSVSGMATKLHGGMSFAGDIRRKSRTTMRCSAT
jgi:uncharacterized protein YeaO (DUF488 family)